MEIFLWISAFCIIVAALVYLLKRLVEKVQRLAKPEQRARNSNPHWSAVTVRPGLISCEAVYAISTKTYLASEAPDLPVPGCTNKKCLCKCIRLQDRRHQPDRRDYFGQFSVYAGWYEYERRSGAGRRSTDKPDSLGA